VERIVQLAAFFILCTLLAGPTHAQTAPAAVDPDLATSGDLFWISAAGAIPLPMTDVDVELRVSGVVIEGRMTQRFVNPTTETIEALYVFPLAEDAAVFGMELRVGDRRIVAEVREREQARRDYERAREDGRKAALVDQQRPNMFRTSAANIGPGETVHVELRFVQKGTRVGDEYRLRFPLAITPRFCPPGTETIPGVNVPRAPTARLVVDVAQGLEFERLESPSHPMQRRSGPRRTRLEASGGKLATDRDFLLTWKPARSEMPQVASFIERRDGERYALIYVQPPRDGSDSGIGLPTETLFVIDVSGSMDGPSIKQARQALTRALERLRPGDRFNILKFNDANEAFAAGFETATDEAVGRARAWVAGLTAQGGTAIYDALDRGLRMVGEGSAGYASRIVFLTDGAVHNERDVLTAIVARLGETRLHTIGIGAAPNGYLMRKMAWHGRGLCEFIASVEQADNRIDAFFDRLERPVWTDLQLNWDGVEAEGVSPGRLPDLHLGEPLVLSAKLSGESGGALTVGGWSVDGWTERVVDLEHDALDNAAIRISWARAQVEDLMDSLHEGADAATVREAVVDLGLAHSLVTAYTSLVAVEQYAGELGDGMLTARALPNTGTLDPLKRRIALLLVLAGILGLAGLRKSL
jgi:Ca-activated chloride channel family protein